MKIKYLNIILIVFSVFIMSCQFKKTNVVCRMVPDNPKLIDCYAKSDTNIRIYFNNKELKNCIIMHNGGYENIEFHQNQNSFFKSIALVNVVPQIGIAEDHLVLQYDSASKLISNTMYHEAIYEGYSRKKVKNGYSYLVHYYLPNLKILTPVYHFTLSENDKLLPDYLYYKQNPDKSYSILTDEKAFLSNNKLIDSMYIEFCESKMEDIEFTKHSDYYYPNFRNKEIKKIKTIDSTIRFINESNVVANMWSFFNKENDFPFAYSMLILNGDLMLRVKKYSYLFDKYEKKYPTGKISELKDLKKSLLQVGFIEKNGGFEPSSDLLEKVQSVIDGNKNTSHSKGS